MYLFFQALELAAKATEECQFKDWWWKVQLAKSYYRYSYSCLREQFSIECWKKSGVCGIALVVLCFAIWKLAPLSWPVRFETDFFAFCFPDLVCIVMPRGSLNLRYVIKTLWILICIFVKCIGGSTNQWLLLKYTKRFVFACYVSPHPLHPCHSAELCLSILRSIFSLVSIVLLRCALSDRWRTFAPATNQ